MKCRGAIINEIADRDVVSRRAKPKVIGNCVKRAFQIGVYINEGGTICTRIYISDKDNVVPISISQEAGANPTIIIFAGSAFIVQSITDPAVRGDADPPV